MEIRNYIVILWRRKWVIAVTTAVTLAVVAIGTVMATPMYAASTTLRVAMAVDASVDYADYLYAERLSGLSLRRFV